MGQPFGKRITKGMRWLRQQLAHAKLAQPGPAGEKRHMGEPPTEPDVAKAILEASQDKQYFVTARSWADDVYTSAIVSRNRYKLAFFVAMGLCVALSIAIDGLIPLQRLAPLLVNHYQDGHVVVQPISQPAAPASKAEVESDLVHYVINRESYDSTSYKSQYILASVLSNKAVANQYMAEQDRHSPNSPINVFGKKGYRTARVETLVFLDSAADNKGLPKTEQTHQNLAKVYFTTTDYRKTSTRGRSHPQVALVSWTYRGTPVSPAEAWQDWNGFTVTRYTVQQRNITSTQGAF